MRYSTTPITELNWNTATSAQLTPIVYPELTPNGTLRSYLVAGLAPGTTYYFAIQSKYEASDWSKISNVVTATTLTSLPIGSPTNSEDGVQNDNSGNGEIFSPGLGAVEDSLNIENPTKEIQPFLPETAISLPITHPTLINGTGLDGEIVFTWNNPNEADFVRTVIVRKLGSYPTSPTDGTIVYESDGETFTDMNLTNGTMYYYAFYAYDHARTYSMPVRVSLAPALQTSSLRRESGNSGSVGQLVFHETPVIIPAEAATHFTVVWKKGDKNIEIEHLQHVLALDGEFYPTTKIDGIFGTITENGLKQFQAKYNLLITGVTDTATQKQLGLVSQSLITLHVSENELVLETNLKQGDKNEAVKGLQEMLADLGSYSGAIDGQFGDQTRAAVSAFQIKYFIKPPSGFVGQKTRHMLKVLSGM